MEYDLVGRVIEWTRDAAANHAGVVSQSLSPSRLARPISTSVAGLVQINAATNGVTSPSSLGPAFARMDAR
jgi:formylglycine-generating enzyme required for sulfatase activity